MSKNPRACLDCGQPTANANALRCGHHRQEHKLAELRDARRLHPERNDDRPHG